MIPVEVSKGVGSLSLTNSLAVMVMVDVYGEAVPMQPKHHEVTRTEAANNHEKKRDEELQILAVFKVGRTSGLPASRPGVGRTSGMVSRRPGGSTRRQTWWFWISILRWGKEKKLVGGGWKLRGKAKTTQREAISTSNT